MTFAVTSYRAIDPCISVCGDAGQVPGTTAGQGFQYLYQTDGFILVYELQHIAVSFSLIRFQVMFCINSRTATYYDPEPAQQKSEYQFSAVCLHDPITELKAKLPLD